ncbi:hypothetical protein KM043_005690 [Ampulex compressa]|nr:hypothetical protein KM043_005690 [Ampulex compressa]
MIEGRNVTSEIRVIIKFLTTNVQIQANDQFQSAPSTAQYALSAIPGIILAFAGILSPTGDVSVSEIHQGADSRAKECQGGPSGDDDSSHCYRLVDMVIIVGAIGGIASLSPITIEERRLRPLSRRRLTSSTCPGNIHPYAATGRNSGL